MIKHLSVLCLVFFITACSDKAVTREEQIRQYIAVGTKAAENRNYSDLADLIHKSYRDHNDFDKQRITKLIRSYFFTHKNIHLFTKIDTITFQSDNQGFVTLYVAMAGNAISDPGALTSLRAKIYKFELQLIKEDKWLLQQARWQRASLKDMLYKPEDD